MSTLHLADQSRLTELMDELRLILAHLLSDNGSHGESLPDGVRRAFHHPAGMGRVLVERLTDREKEMACALAAGMSNKSIARQYFISVNTVRFHVRNVLHKLEVTGREDVAFVLADGLVANHASQSRQVAAARVFRLA